jgi:dTDP-4-amino-4,6-dideoxygalactose transaminase
MRVAKAKRLAVIEDAAHSIGATYRNRPLGSLGQLATLSFHATKNLSCGEGGALLINDDSLVERAEIIREKGTNRNQFLRGQIDKYTWTDVGSSFLPSELCAAYLWAQLGSCDRINRGRIELWNRYHSAFGHLEEAGFVKRAVVEPEAKHNGHLYFLLLEDETKRDRLVQFLKEQGIQASFHYVPLHSSPAGRRLGRCYGVPRRTEQIAASIVRLPLHSQLSEKEQDRVVAGVFDFFAKH